MWNANQRFPGKALTIRVSPEGHKAKPERLEIILADEEDEAKVVAAFSFKKGETEYNSSGSEETGLLLMLYSKDPEWDGVQVWSNPNYGNIKFIHKEFQKCFGCDLKKADVDEIFRIIIEQAKKLKFKNIKSEK
jgi:hypothetical protein